MLTSKQKSDWMAALRSGMYEQGVGHLERDGKFCCLGVLAKINGLPTNGNKLTRSDHHSINLDNSNLYISPYGNFDECGMPALDIYLSLSDLSDSGKYSFTQIADHIERHLPTKG